MKIKEFLFPITLFLFGVSPVLACDCKAGEVAKSLKRAEAIFSGKVIARKYREITDADDKDFGSEFLTVRLKVDKWWKGNGSSEVLLKTRVVRNVGKNQTRKDSCDYSFQIREDYLVFAYLGKGWLTTNACAGTKKLSSAAKDIDQLDESFQLKGISTILKSYPQFSALDLFLFN